MVMPGPWECGGRRLPEGTGDGQTVQAARSSYEGPVKMSFSAAGPGETDQVIDAAGAHVYIEPQAAVYLEDKVLDAQVDSEGQAHFSLGMQGPG